MNAWDYAFDILSRGNIEDKLIEFDFDEPCYKFKQSMRFISPIRASEILFSKKQLKFPKKGRLKTDEGKALALHFFANHELLAIEMMAQAILLFDDLAENDIKSLLQTIQEEQKHFKLYCERLEDFGHNFGDFPVNAFFWHQMRKIENSEEFFAVVALTFEQANLDFASFYKKLFEEIGDHQTANVFNVIYLDEIKHVARGKKFLNKKMKSDQKLWDYYCDILPVNVTPSRAKGMIFDEKGRSMAGLEDSYIKNLESYKDDFVVTQRKQWKK